MLQRGGIQGVGLKPKVRYGPIAVVQCAHEVAAKAIGIFAPHYLRENTPDRGDIR